MHTTEEEEDGDAVNARCWHYYLVVAMLGVILEGAAVGTAGAARRRTRASRAARARGSALAGFAERGVHAAWLSALQ